jgi:CBS domain-containing protein
MLVEELMTTDVVTVDSDATLREAVEQSLTHGVGSVIVLADGNPAGIVTESDALEAALETGRPLDEIPVAKLYHGSIVTTQSTRTVQRVARRMADNDVKKVPVIDDLDLVGIVTHSDIVWHLSDIRREASRLDAAHDRWQSGTAP